MPRHLGKTALVASLLALSQVSVGAAASAVGPTRLASPPAVAAGAIAIDAGAAATASADVTVTVPMPTTSAGLLRVSDDGGTTWVEIPYTSAFAWSLTEAAAGGTDSDGQKTVTVEAGDGAGSWAALGTDAILLDRTPPTTSVLWVSPDYWGQMVSFGATDAGVGLARTEVSLDGAHWRSLNPSPFTFFGRDYLDLREGTIGGSWALGLRTVYARAVDRLGNTSPMTSTDIDLIDPEASPDDPPATFEFPRPAVSGELYTIKPVFDAGFRIRAGDFCEWRLKAGDSDARLEAAYNETLIDVEFPVSPVNGVCAPWTFTLPYTPPLEYTWSLAIMRGETESVYNTSDLAGSFRAVLGSTSRAITYSSLPLSYVLPDREIVGSAGTVTYRLHTAGGMSVTSGGWMCRPAIHAPAPQGYAPQSQTGGTSFVCRITSSGSWAAGWYRFAGGRRWLAQYDPVSDRHRPVVGKIWVLPTGAGTKVSLRWAATDHGTGVARYELAVSRNGGSYKAIALPSHRTTTIDASVVLGSKYRFRVRAVDRAGNVGAWVYSPTIVASRYDDTSTSVHWTGSWVAAPTVGALMGSVRSAPDPGSAAWLRFSGRSIGWMAPRGPGEGFAQVWVDGVLAATIDLSAPSARAPVVVWRKSWSSPGTHLVRIRVLGTIGRPNVSIDGFAVLR